MKKSRIILTTAIVIAAVGSSLAFKSSHAFGNGSLSCTVTRGAICPSAKDYDPGTTLTRFCGTPGQACNTQTTVDSNP